METKNKTNKFSTRISNDQNIRLLVQTAFLLLILRIGYEFYGFVKYYQTNGATPYFERPPGVEGFLPISSLMGLIHFVTTGDFNSIHPAGIVLFFIFFLFAILLKKGFCGWVCPVGFFSEYLWKLGRKVFGRNFVLPRWLDYPLRSLKYLILLFFVWAIVTMSSGELSDFLYGKYNKIADVKMLLFFTDISAFALGIIIALAVLSLFIKNFWCRYLCPYGAFLGFFSLFSPLKVTRNPDTCTDCRHCTEACPSNISVHTKTRIHSDECMACAACITACPETDTLKFRLHKKAKRSIPVKVYALILIGLFIIGTGLAMLTGHWKNSVKPDEYKTLIQQINDPEMDHVN